MWKIFKRPEHILLPVGRDIEVVYWSQEHRENIGQENPGRRWLTIEREPTNPADRRAVIIKNGHGPIGYLPAAEAARYSPALRGASIPIKVRIMFGRRSRGDRAVHVTLASPDKIQKAIERFR